MAENDSAVEKMEETDEAVREGGDEQDKTGSTVTANEQQPGVETLGSLGQRKITRHTCTFLASPESYRMLFSRRPHV